MRGSLKNRSVVRAAAATNIHRLGCGAGGGHSAGQLPLEIESLLGKSPGFRRELDTFDTL